MLKFRIRSTLYSASVAFRRVDDDEDRGDWLTSSSFAAGDGVRRGDRFVKLAFGTHASDDDGKTIATNNRVTKVDI
jgi:hypothetical protein